MTGESRSGLEGKESVMQKVQTTVKLNEEVNRTGHIICKRYIFYYMHISVVYVSVYVCAAVQRRGREERAEGVYCGSLCGSDCPLLWESGNSTLLSRGLVTR